MTVSAPPDTTPGPIPAWMTGLTSPLDERLGRELLEVTPARVRARYPVAGNTQPFGLWHGGASCVVAETLASLGAAAEVGPRGQAVGVDINATHHATVRSGWVHGQADALRIGGSLASYEVRLRNDEGDLVCTARVTLQLRRAREGS